MLPGQRVIYGGGTIPDFKLQPGANAALVQWAVELYDGAPLAWGHGFRQNSIIELTDTDGFVWQLKLVANNPAIIAEQTNHGKVVEVHGQSATVAFDRGTVASVAQSDLTLE